MLVYCWLKPSDRAIGLEGIACQNVAHSHPGRIRVVFALCDGTEDDCFREEYKVASPTVGVCWR